MAKQSPINYDIHPNNQTNDLSQTNLTQDLADALHKKRIAKTRKKKKKKNQKQGNEEGASARGDGDDGWEEEDSWEREHRVIRPLYMMMMMHVARRLTMTTIGKFTSILVFVCVFAISPPLSSSEPIKSNY